MLEVSILSSAIASACASASALAPGQTAEHTHEDPI